MSTLIGTWNLSMRTPIGTMHATMTFRDDHGSLSGTADGASESVVLRDIRTEPVTDGERVTWSQTITTPMRLNLEFDVVVSGDRMSGHSRAGRLPRTSVTGTRAAG
jgi:hypothetical protein